mmetsp:Transcript_17832/g.54840  ORF Transcript_17832/g.54840 Transcript_17832/m.54840 type:complete len:210 (+) Transcript_17832:105-734(+)
MVTRRSEPSTSTSVTSCDALRLSSSKVTASGFISSHRLRTPYGYDSSSMYVRKSSGVSLCAGLSFETKASATPHPWFASGSSMLRSADSTVLATQRGLVSAPNDAAPSAASGFGRATGSRSGAFCFFFFFGGGGGGAASSESIAASVSGCTRTASMSQPRRSSRLSVQTAVPSGDAFAFRRPVRTVARTPSRATSALRTSSVSNVRSGP